ncbi:unnamed protein product [Timema podura]|uniref:Uncharacterized protein n=1 Tax=Timema podura TaxID=61482 RepID=A0ABN7PF25_TIMPD|nr:unnamed protein product [Timema podura]
MGQLVGVTTRATLSTVSASSGLSLTTNMSHKCHLKLYKTVRLTFYSISEIVRGNG